MLLCLLCLIAPARAQDDYAEAAKQRMQLDFDLDQVQAELKRKPSPRAAPPSAAPHHGWEDAPPPAPPGLPLEPNSAVDAVTVLRDRAMVTRVRSATLAPGSQVVTFEGLPHGIRADGLAGAIRSGRGRIVGVELVSGTGEPEKEGPRAEKLRADALALTEQLGQVQDRIEALLAQRAYLRFTLIAPRGEGVPPPSLAEVRNALDYVGSAEAALARDLRREEERARELADQLRPLLIKRANPVATGRTVRVEVAGPGGEVEVGLRYAVAGASWEPAYNARLLDDGTVRLEVFGVVRQGTGEDWRDASLSLSTADATGSGALPELTPWLLGRGAGGLVAGTGAVTEGRVPTAGPPESELLSSDLTAAVAGVGAVVFPIEGRRTLAGDGSSTRIPVGTQTFSARLDHVAVPKLAAEVHRRATIRYDGPIPLLPGALGTFAGADFLRNGRTTAVVPGEALQLSFGGDDRLKLTRQLVRRNQELVGSGKRTTRYTLHFRTTLANLSKEPRSVELRDQLPVSEIDRVEVKLVQITPGFREDPLADAGARVWDLTLAPGEERTIDLEFTVTAPNDVAPRVINEMQEMMM